MLLLFAPVAMSLQCDTNSVGQILIAQGPSEKLNCRGSYLLRSEHCSNQKRRARRESYCQRTFSDCQSVKDRIDDRGRT